ncbi:MAG TPA: hypothetical protein PKY56_08010 [Candidatus Kapabacteria bacterium]|nr:hypothetical protein [Candidatus Kapabacteria bacterium]
MQLKPVKIKKELGFPTINEFAQNPELLYKNIPSSWLKNKYVATSLAMFVLCGNASNAQVPIKNRIDYVLQQEQKEKTSKKKETKKVKEVKKQEKKEITEFSPLIESMGSVGCVSVAPPVYITEKEAYEIILNIFKDENIELDTINCPEIKFNLQPNDREVKLKIDAYNKEHNIAVEYVTSADKKSIDLMNTHLSSGYNYFREPDARFIYDELKNQGYKYSGVFYDEPVYADYTEKNWEESIEKARQEVKSNLIKQVQEFIIWLKNEGILEK